MDLVIDMFVLNKSQVEACCLTVINCGTSKFGVSSDLDCINSTPGGNVFQSDSFSLAQRLNSLS